MELRALCTSELKYWECGSNAKVNADVGVPG